MRLRGERRSPLKGRSCIGHELCWPHPQAAAAGPTAGGRRCGATSLVARSCRCCLDATRMDAPRRRRSGSSKVQPRLAEENDHGRHVGNPTQDRDRSSGPRRAVSDLRRPSHAASKKAAADNTTTWYQVPRSGSTPPLRPPTMVVGLSRGTVWWLDV